MQRRHWITLASLVVAATPVLTTSAWAQAWPARPIKLVVPFPPGGLIDNLSLIHISEPTRRS